MRMRPEEFFYFQVSKGVQGDEGRKKDNSPYRFGTMLVLSAIYS